LENEKSEQNLLFITKTRFSGVHKSADGGRRTLIFRARRIRSGIL
jgi:hypothetical protein